MILLITIIPLLIVVSLALCITRLKRERVILRQRIEAWKDFACALEAAFEAEAESHDAWRYKRMDHWKVAKRQYDNACNYAELSLIRLCESGEYEDAHESSPFMPRGSTLSESIESLKQQRITR